MRYLLALAVAALLLMVSLWVGSWIATSVSQGTRIDEEFLRGASVNLCGYEVDSRYSLAGYDLDQYRGSRCESLSELDHCILGCLSIAGTIESAGDCYDDCVAAR
jgi:hypothetical protein